MFDNLSSQTQPAPLVSSQVPQWDIVIVGAGVVGCLCASALSRYQLKTLVIDREADVCMGASAGNSAIIHAGYDPLPGTHKARSNVEGNRLWGELAKTLDIPFQRCGSLVVALDPSGLPRIRELFGRGTENGVDGLRIVFQPELSELEPALGPNAHAALWAPSAGIIDPFAACLAPAEHAALNGVRFQFDTEVMGLAANQKGISLETTQGAIVSRFVLNCAGLGSGTLLAMAEPERNFKITARRGEYLIVESGTHSPRRVLFPIPNVNTKGILVAPTTHGNTLLGPNAEAVADPADTATTAPGLNEVFAGASTLVPGFSKSAVIANYSGLRASGTTRDFVVEFSASLPGLLNLAGIDSPGFAAAPSLALEAVDLLAGAGLELRERLHYVATRQAIPRFAILSESERQALAKTDPSWSRIVCRCELVTEAEVLAALRSPLPARSYDGIKRRTWLGTGRCQGAFDLPRVIELICRETGCQPEDVTKNGPGSAFIMGRTR